MLMLMLDDAKGKKNKKSKNPKKKKSSSEGKCEDMEIERMSVKNGHQEEEY